MSVEHRYLQWTGIEVASEDGDLPKTGLLLDLKNINRWALGGNFVKKKFLKEIYAIKSQLQ